MAIDTTEKRQSIAAELMMQNDIAMDAISNCAVLYARIQAEALTFGDSDFSTVEGLKHLDATTFDAAAAEFDYTNSSKLAGWMVANNKSVILGKLQP